MENRQRTEDVDKNEKMLWDYKIYGKKEFWHV